MESDVKRKTPKLSLSAGGVLLFVAFCALADPPQVPDDTVPQVTVHAQREAIEPRVKRFVDEYFYLENDEGPARWISHVCPSVVGMTRGEGEFILQRLSFLEALYHSDPALVQQTQTMVTRMVRHIVPEDTPEPPPPQ